MPACGTTAGEIRCHRPYGAPLFSAYSMAMICAVDHTRVQRLYGSKVQRHADRAVYYKPQNLGNGIAGEIVPP